MREIRLHVSFIPLLMLPLAAPAQWARQEVPLRSGWNAVYLSVDPQPARIDDALAGLGAESVWMWNRSFVSTEFLTEPATPVQENPDWLVWAPRSLPQSATRTLEEFIGGRCYLIKIRGSSAEPLRLVGRPVLPNPSWVGSSFNLVGFAFSATTTPTASEFFGGRSELLPLDLRYLTPTGDWQKQDPSARLRPNMPLFIFAGSPSVFRGPVEVDRLGRDGIAFGDTTITRSMVVRNTSATISEITLRHLASETPPPGQPVSAGAVPLTLQRLEVQTSADLSSFEPFAAGAEQKLTLAPGEERLLQFAMDPQLLPEPPAGVDYRYQGLLEVLHPSGFQLLVPVSAEGFAGEEVIAADGRKARRTSSARNTKSVSGPVLEGRQGLWVGEVRIDAVSNLASNSPTPVPTGQDLRQRLILHTDNTTDAVRLLKQVLVLTRRTDTGTKTALVTDEALLASGYGGAVMRGGSLSGMRISSAAYPFFRSTGEPANTLPGTGTFEDGTASRADSVSFVYTLGYQDPVNPFVHRYHPDHDNLDAQFDAQKPLPEGRESYSIRHEITLSFTPTDTDPQSAGVTPPGWLGTTVGGRYTERIYGLLRTDYTNKRNETLYRQLGASAYWSFDEGSGTTFAESVKGISTSTPSGATWVQGRIGGALNFNGTAALIPNASFPDVPTGGEPYTISAWTNVSGSTGDRYIVYWGNIRPSEWMGLLIRNNVLMNFWHTLDLTGSYSSSNVSRWTHVAATYDGTTRRLYVNGAPVAEDTVSGKNTHRNDFRIGQGFVGSMDELSIYKRALSPAEITQLATIGTDGNNAYTETPVTLSGYFRLNRISTENTLNPPATVLNKKEN